MSSEMTVLEALQGVKGTELKVTVKFLDNQSFNVYIVDIEEIGDNIVLSMKTFWRNPIFNGYLHDVLEVDTPDELEFFRNRRAK